MHLHNTIKSRQTGHVYISCPKQKLSTNAFHTVVEKITSAKVAHHQVIFIQLPYV